jgi:predicted enzyme related to lactoylglutathione lyase
MTAHGAFAWNELATADVEKARRFYEETLGWTFESFQLPDGPYSVAKVGDQMVAGMGGLETGAVKQSTSCWFAFIEVTDLDARVEKAKRLGATVVQAPHDVPAIGRVAVLRDPTGAVIGWMTSAP